MKISVLMSIYYKEKVEYFKKAIDSILKQSRIPDEIVIIKDGKLTTELDEVLEEYREKYSIIKIYDLQKNEGLGNALRFGINKCSYEYIARMDTDDIAYLDRLEEQEKILKQNPEIDILGGNIEEYDENMDKIISIRNVPLTMKKIKKSIKTQNPFNHGTVIMKKSAVLKVGNYQNVKFEDYDLWARMLIGNCNMANMDKVLIKFRSGNSMYKRRSGVNQIKAIIQIENKLLKYKIINIFEYIYNLVIRISVALIPVKIKKYMYIKIIRKI